MNSHRLSVDVNPFINSTVLSLYDTSIYIDGIEIECPTLHILPPGFTESIEIPVDKGFIINLSACDLELQIVNCDNYSNDLPDGVYAIRYSIAPNDEVYVEYNYLRTVLLEKKFYEVMCCIDTNVCEPDAKTEKLLKRIDLLRTMLFAAKAQVEFCHKPAKGTEMYEFVKKELNKIACQCNCNCCQ